MFIRKDKAEELITSLKYVRENIEMVIAKVERVSKNDSYIGCADLELEDLSSAVNFLSCAIETSQLCRKRFFLMYGDERPKLEAVPDETKEAS